MPENTPHGPRRKPEENKDPEHDDQTEIQAPTRFSPEEEAALLSESNAQKSQANALFGSSQYSEAIGTYDKAIASCPNYLEYELAVLKSNIAACHLKLEDWKAAVDEATKALDALGRLENEGSNNMKAKDQNQPAAATNGKTENQNGEVVVELDEEGDDAEELERLKISDQRREDIQRIKAKALMRRAKARSEQGGWANLQGAEEDYKQLSTMQNLPPQDLKIVRQALASLPLRISAAKEKEMGEMMGKLKELGNGILKPFGLSTDNFKMTKDEQTGGYSMNFQQGT
ncbi:MAG: hypothetical protein Q9190_005431 [Brigantiaea leucoxantha]